MALNVYADIKTIAQNQFDRQERLQETYFGPGDFVWEGVTVPYEEKFASVLATFIFQDETNDIKNIIDNALNVKKFELDIDKQGAQLLQS